MVQITKTFSIFCIDITNWDLQKDLLDQVFPQFHQSNVRKKKRLSSTQRAESPKLKASSVSSSRETRVLTRSSTKNKGKSIEPSIAKSQSPSEEIHVTEFEAKILREAKISTPYFIFFFALFYTYFLGRIHQFQKTCKKGREHS